jgi:hypothetical protein
VPAIGAGEIPGKSSKAFTAIIMSRSISTWFGRDTQQIPDRFPLSNIYLIPKKIALGIFRGVPASFWPSTLRLPVAFGGDLERNGPI